MHAVLKSRCSSGPFLIAHQHCDAGSISDRVKGADAAQASPEDNPFEVAEENRRLRREVERLRREDEIPLKASALLAGRWL